MKSNVAQFYPNNNQKRELAQADTEAHETIATEVRTDGNRTCGFFVIFVLRRRVFFIALGGGGDDDGGGVGG